VICNLGIGQVAEGRQVFPSLTVLENLEMGGCCRARGLPRRPASRTCSACFPRLAERRDQLAGTLSAASSRCSPSAAA